MTLNKNENIEIEISVKTYIPLIIFSFLATFAYLLGFIKFLSQSFSNHSFDIIQILLGVVVIFVSFQVFMWSIHGKEKLQISTDKMLFIRTNGLLTIKNSVNISDVKSVIINPISFPSDSFIDKKRQHIKEMQGVFFFWYNMGKIEFKIKNNNRSFFNGMTDRQATETVLLISERLKINYDR